MADPKRRGLKVGTKSEFTIFAKIKPGHGEAVREAIRRGGFSKVDELVGTLHEARSVLFDNDTRFMFCTTFDGDWDTYIEDFGAFSKKVDNSLWDLWSEHVEGFPGIGSPNIKDWFQAHQVESVFYISVYGASVKEVLKALELQKAFQQVLDDPAAAKALANPALKPLLDRAAA